MPRTAIDTNSPNYQRLLGNLEQLRAHLTPFLRLLKQLPEQQRLRWLQRDPLMRRALRLAREFQGLLHLEVTE